MSLHSLIDGFKIRQLEKSINWNASIPKHIAIMMDGNGRWGARKGLSRSAGHYAGMQTMKNTIANCQVLNIPYLTLYAFSTENWKRPKSEVDFIIGLVHDFVNDKFIQEMNRNHIKVKFVGDLQRFSLETQQLMNHASILTSSNEGMTVNFAMNYGGRSEIVHAVKALISDEELQSYSEQDLEDHLYTTGLPSPELIIRTSGEQRLSGFMLWQAAQAELWFTDELWPNFNKRLLYQAILDYQTRKKRQNA